MTAARFWAKVEKTETCWLWTGRPNHAGYGRFNQTMAHRFAYVLIVGDIPDDLTLDHLCKNRLCVNPAHLEPVTQAENTRRSTAHTNGNEKRTHCVNGHEFTPENTRSTPKQRTCRTCARDRANTAYRAKKAA